MVIKRLKLCPQPPALSYGDPKGSCAPSLPYKVNPTQAVADLLGPLRKFAMQQVREAAGSSKLVPEDSVMWCLTVPAMWGEQAKAAMQMAAVRAGMIPTAESERLIIILEPEAAALAAKVRALHRLDCMHMIYFLPAGCIRGTCMYVAVSTCLVIESTSQLAVSQLIA